MGLEDYLKRLRYEPIFFELTEGNAPVVYGNLGEKKLRFLVDTGWGFTALSPSAAAGLKTLGELGMILEDEGYSLTNASLVVIDKLTLGQTQFLNQPARVKVLKFQRLQHTWDGVLGWDFFRRTFSLFDCGAGRLYVRPTKPSPETATALANTLRRSGYTEVPMREGWGMVVAAQINGQAVPLMVDTGAAFTTLDDSQPKRLSLKVEKREQATTGTAIQEDYKTQFTGVGEIGAHEVRMARLGIFQIGSRQWKKYPVGIMDLKAWNTAEPGKPGAEVLGMLGMEFLAGQGTIIDYANCTLWFRPEKPGKKK
jgi:predicted aspartyl protease